MAFCGVDLALLNGRTHVGTTFSVHWISPNAISLCYLLLRVVIYGNVIAKRCCALGGEARGAGNAFPSEDVLGMRYMKHSLY